MVIPPRDSAKPKYARLSIQLGRSLQPMAFGDGLLTISTNSQGGETDQWGPYLFRHHTQQRLAAAKN
jgi:hypothetical protein